MKRLLAFLALCLPIYLFSQGFGSFTHDQPYLAKDSGAGDEATEFLYLLYDADLLGLSDGNLVSSYTDQGVYKYHAITNLLGTQPYWTNNVGEINNEGYVYFDTAGDSLSTNIAVTFPQPYHSFFVLKVEEPSSVFGKVIAQGVPTRTLFTSTGNYVSDSGCQQGSLYQTNNWVILETIYDGVNSEIRTNNALLSYGPLGLGGMGTVVFGGAGSVDTALYKHAYYAVHTNRLSDAAATTIVNDLGTRFGITTYAREAKSTWNPAVNSSLLSLYDLAVVNTNNGSIITRVPDSGSLAYHLRTTNSPLYLSNFTTNRGMPHIGFNIFGGANQMAGTNFTSIFAQPTTVIFVMDATLALEGGFDWYVDNCYAPSVLGTNQAVFKDGGGSLYLTAGATLASSTVNQSAFGIYEWYFNGGSSHFKTNNVTVTSGDAGTNVKQGISIAGARNWDTPYMSPMNLYWAAFYTNTLSATERSNIYVYLGTNRFGIPVTVP